MSSTKFEGWVAQNASAAQGEMEWSSFDPKPFEETDIEMDVTHCGICGSDIHTLRSGWGPSDYPLVVGHEIIGKVTRVGEKVRDVKVGDRVGVGAQSGSCLHCKRCESDLEPHCTGGTNTYNSKFPNGGKAYGGYANKWRGPSAFAFTIPEGLPSETAAPLLCGGLTVYSPLVQNNAGPGKRVGVIGLGGLGHFGVLFAKALKCDKVVVISRSSSKKDDALKMGADDFIATDEDPDWDTKHADSLDLLISTASGTGFPLDKYLNLLDVKGTMIQVGVPEGNLPPMHAFQLIAKRLKIGGSAIGGRKEMVEMLKLAEKEKLKAWVEVVPMKDANRVVVEMDKGKARYRYVLAN